MFAFVKISEHKKNKIVIKIGNTRKFRQLLPLAVPFNPPKHPHLSGDSCIFFEKWENYENVDIENMYTYDTQTNFNF